ncbi:potassium channel family protein [Allorhodopirellula heiligendammensis]|uniref:Voltage-gated potassium channel n=1 Tax=Allorhodopirellula heiligendammensis TaxID=2714739 RepID=A0A5C6BZA0_9BACT|nr:potassium channel family protein [Allorhodopirellula heiligendammensis]TWU17027.1 voltage-gated potassium channel [Allorhodopirellula heiligendammensis]
MLVREVLFCLICLVFGGGVIFSFTEDLDLDLAIYFACITGLTIGYGEIVPHTPLGRLVAVLIGVIGMVFIGLIVGIAARALADVEKMRTRFDRHPK